MQCCRCCQCCRDMAEPEESKPEPEKQEITFKIESNVSNGIFGLKIENVHSLFPTKAHPTDSFEFYHRSSNLNGNEWSVHSIELLQLLQPVLYIRVPVLLNEYTFEFYFKVTHGESHQIFKSNTTQIQVPSFLLYSNFQRGETVLFKPDDGWFTYNAVISDILEDDHYEIQYYKYDPSKGARSDRNAWTQIKQSIHFSRVFSDRKRLDSVIDLTDYKQIYHNTLIKRNDTQSMQTFFAIHEALKNLMNAECKGMYGGLEWLSHRKAMNEFMAKNIFDMLYLPQFEYHLTCFVDGEDGWLTFENLRQCDSRLTYQMIAGGEMTNHNVVDFVSRGHVVYSCDWCSIEIKDWDFVSPCKAQLADQHYFCINCINTVICLNEELKQLLTEILLDETFVSDCIQAIVDFVVGKVVKRQLNDIVN